MHNHRGPKLMLFLAALSLVIGAASYEHASAASKPCMKECKSLKKQCLQRVKQELKTSKELCKNIKIGGLALCPKRDGKCKKSVKSDFRQCMKGARKTFKREKKQGCRKGFKKQCKPCCKKNKKLVGVCEIANCADGIRVEGELCDDGNPIDGDGCDSNCTPTSCGNNITTAPEECDDGNPIDGDGCDSNCTATGCGNGIVTGDELCDDGNLADGDGCDSNCTPTGCGNSIVTQGEECDDGPLNSDTDPNANCRLDCTLRCADEPCLLDPVPTKLQIVTQLPDGVCGCTLKSAGETSCDGPTVDNGGSKIGDLDCGKLLVGGGLSAVPPGPTPDGATTFVSLSSCCATEMAIGPSAGDGPKSCSFGANEPGGPCFYGPALSVENENPSMSTCVLNTLRENIAGVLDTETGHATMSVALTSRVFLTGDLIGSTCLGGPIQGAPCSRSPLEPRDQCAACVGGSNAGSACQSNLDCNSGVCGGICADQVFGECEEDGASCRVGTCDGGPNPGQACCPDCAPASPCDGRCVGGLFPGRQCSSNAQCIGGGSCENRGVCKGICVGGSNPTNLCTSNAECNGGTCTISDCPTGKCEQAGQPLQPCPTCVDPAAAFSPITDGSTGECNLGENKGEACVSTNSLGLTIDCPPEGGPTEEVGEGNEGYFLADIEVSLPAITTGQTMMTANTDGTFCNFGRCDGGTQDGAACNNLLDCPGGTCQKLCQIKNGPDDRPPGPECNVQDDCDGGVDGWRPCGQPDGGAFIRTAFVDKQARAVGGPEVRRIIMEGVPAPAPLRVGETKNSKAVAVFCIPRTGDKAIDNAGSLPGPGAMSVQVQSTLLDEE